MYLLLIQNQLKAMKIIGNIEKVCKKEKLEYEICYTLAPGDATRLAQSYKDQENMHT